VTDFRSLGVSEAVADVLARRGIEHPFQIQALVIPEALQGGDVLAKSPTGSGKTLAFAIPIVERLDVDDARPAALILVPTRELCAQVTEEFELIAGDQLNVASVYGGVPLKAQANEAKNAHVVVATPGRLQDLVDRRLLTLDKVSVLILDEADRMLDMGFKPQVDKIVRLLSDNRQTMFFSATLDGEVGELARRYTHFPARFEGELPAERRTGQIDHRFVPVTPDNKVTTLVELLNDTERGLALVFVRTKAGADRLVEKLRRHDVDAVAIHGDKGQAQRERALARFDAGKVRTLVATDVAARGLDITGVSHVVNYDVPNSPDVYVHRIGRTGRAGESGRAVTIITPKQRRELEAIERHAKTEIEEWSPNGKPRATREHRRDPERETRRPRHTKPHPRDGVPYAKLILSAGRQQGLEPADIVSAVVDNSHLENDDVRNVKVLERFAFVEVPADRAGQVAEAVSGNEVRGTQLRAEVTQRS
jgi:superfamily II DNA/RNA helicase